MASQGALPVKRFRSLGGQRFLLANVLADPIGDLGKQIIDEPTTRYLVSWGITFIAVLLVFGVIAAFLSKQMRQPGFNVGNRLLGGIFGFFRG